MKAKANGPQAPQYIDRPEISEVFADRLEHLFFDGGAVRMEFTVVRPDPPAGEPGKPATEPKRWSYTACRVVLSAQGIAEMLNKMQELQAILLQQGMVQARTPEPAALPADSGSPRPH